MSEENKSEENKVKEQEREKEKEKADHSAVDFSALVLGFSSAALYYIGHSSIEGKKPQEINLPLAKQNIDILRLLKEKCRGNLSADEQKLIDQVLADLSRKFATAEQKS